MFVSYFITSFLKLLNITVSRSVSILSKGSSSSNISRSSSRVFKPINESSLLDENDISLSHSFDDINDFAYENRSSFNSTPTSDLWDTHKTNEECDFEDTVVIDGFNPDGTYLIYKYIS